MKVQGRRKRRRPKRRWLDRVRDDIKEKRLSGGGGVGGEYTTVLHGRACHRTPTPHKSRNTMKRRRKKEKKRNTIISIICSKSKTIHRYCKQTLVETYFREGG